MALGGSIAISACLERGTGFAAVRFVSVLFGDVSVWGIRRIVGLRLPK